MPAAGNQPGPRVFLPLIFDASACPDNSRNAYQTGPAIQWDSNNPVRLVWNHADKNLALRGYTSNPSAFKGCMNYGSIDRKGPPQLASLFSASRVPAFTGA